MLRLNGNQGQCNQRTNRHRQRTVRACNVADYLFGQCRVSKKHRGANNSGFLLHMAKQAPFQSTQDATEAYSLYGRGKKGATWISGSFFDDSGPKQLSCGLVAMIQGYVKRSRGFNHVDKLLKRFRVPGRSVHCFKSCSQKLLQQAKHAIRAAAKANCCG